MLDTALNFINMKASSCNFEGFGGLDLNFVSNAV